MTELFEIGDLILGGDEPGFQLTHSINLYL